MKRFSLLRMGALIAFVVSLAPPPTKADDYDKKAIVNFNQPTEVPGIVLQPGTYVIKLLGSQSNRHIAEIMNEKMDHLYALTFTAAAERVERTGKPVLTFYEGAKDQPQAIRKWFWPGEVTGIEFLYPKAQAARIAAASHQRVAEGGLPTVAESGQPLIPDSAKSVTVQSQEESKPVAAPLVADAAEPVAAPPPPVEIAQNTPPPPPQTSLAAEAPQSNSPAVSADVTSPVANSSETSLPQTASYLPLIGALGIVSLAAAMLLASVRRYRSL
jgi:hypothetical protein